MNLIYERDTAHNYMIPQREQYVAEDDYRVHMLMENQIRGLLPCGIRKKDGIEEFRYDITSRQSLEHLYSGRCMGEEEIRILMKGLFFTIAELKKYLLDASMLVLDPQMIYLDVETREPAFCYLPGYKKEIMVSFQELSVYILRHLDAMQESTVLLGYRIYREASEENYCLDQLLRMVVVHTEEMAVRNIDMADISVSGRKERSRMEWGDTVAETDGLQQKKAYISERLPEEWAEAPEEQNFEKEAGKQKTLGGSKKEKQKKGKRKEKMCRKKEKAQKNIEKSRQQKTEKEAERKKFTGKTFLIICFVLALIMTIAAAWLWKLTVMQTGGIIFLLVGLMAYGCSLEPKKASAREKEMDYESYGLEEQPYIMEEIKWEQETEMDKHYENEGRAGASHQAIQEKKTREYSEQRTKNRQEIYRKSEREGRRTEKERLGDTCVLYERDLAEEPLMLTRINSQKQEYIVLLQDQYTVGKLNTEADFVIHEPSVSRVHAKIQRNEGKYFVRDLNSTNGTFLNERRLRINERVQIQPGDTIAFARAEYRVGRC